MSFKSYIENAYFIFSIQGVTFLDHHRLDNLVVNLLCLHHNIILDLHHVRTYIQQVFLNKIAFLYDDLYDLDKTYSNLLLASSSEEEEKIRKDPEDDGKKWITCTEYEPDIDILLVRTGGDIMVDDTRDVYSIPTPSPKKK